MDLPADKLLLLMHKKIQNPLYLDEFVEPHIEKILTDISIADIAYFINDMNKKFKKFVEEEKFNEFDSNIVLNEGLISRLKKWMEQTHD